MNLLRAIPKTVIGAVDELFPTVMDAAGESYEQWRADDVEAYCPRCGASAGPGAVTAEGCSFCMDRRLAWHRLVRLSAYSQPMNDWIRAMKYQRQWRWAPWLGERLAEALGPSGNAQRTLVCPVPMHWTRRWHRGYNQADLIARQIAKQRHWRLAPLLRRTRRTLPQTAVAPSQRAGNVANAFAIHPVDLSGYEVVLVDDVKTTGATLSNCARLLRTCKPRLIRAAVVAVADQQHPHFKVVSS